jgi:hypothetical protein
VDIPRVAQHQIPGPAVLVRPKPIPETLGA